MEPFGFVDDYLFEDLRLRPDERQRLYERDLRCRINEQLFHEACRAREADLVYGARSAHESHPKHRKHRHKKPR